MNLSKGKVGESYKVLEINNTEKRKNFLLSLGCHEGEVVTLISIVAGNFVINIKDSRYAIDKKMAKSISVKEIH